MSKTTRRLLWLAPALIAVIASVLLASGPVLVESYLLADLFGSISDPPVVVLNPVRDRSPERAASTFLAQLAAGQARTALVDVCDGGEELERLADRETQHPLQTWTRYTRRDSGNETMLTVWPSRASYGLATSPPVVVVLRREGDAYRVVRYTAAF